jgi:hypothetical protein
MAANPVLGTWRLLSLEVFDDDGNVSFPLGQHVEGYITYDSDGRMSVQFGKANRPRLAVPDWLIAADAEISAAARGFFAYCGSYELQKGSVSHRIDFSLIPNWIGEVFVRSVEFGEDTITLSTPPTPVEGRMQVATLVWQRVGGGPLP